jgi:hypothetical protein
MARPARTAAASPSIAKGTPASDRDEPVRDDPATNVIIGCTEATCAPRRRSAANSSLASAPLECNATLPFQSAFCASERAASAMESSGTQNQTKSDSITARATPTGRAPTLFANKLALRRDPRLSRNTIWSMTYPARCRHTARTAPRFPAPAIVIRRRRRMPGRIAEAQECRSQKSKCRSKLAHRARVRV